MHVFVLSFTYDIVGLKLKIKLLLNLNVGSS